MRQAVHRLEAVVRQQLQPLATVCIWPGGVRRGSRERLSDGHLARVHHLRCSLGQDGTTAAPTPPFPNTHLLNCSLTPSRRLPARPCPCPPGAAPTRCGTCWAATARRRPVRRCHGGSARRRRRCYRPRCRCRPRCCDAAPCHRCSVSHERGCRWTGVRTGRPRKREGGKHNVRNTGRRVQDKEARLPVAWGHAVHLHWGTTLPHICLSAASASPKLLSCGSYHVCT